MLLRAKTNDVGLKQVLPWTKGGKRVDLNLSRNYSNSDNSGQLKPAESL